MREDISANEGFTGTSMREVKANSVELLTGYFKKECLKERVKKEFLKEPVVKDRVEKRVKFLKADIFNS